MRGAAGPLELWWVDLAAEGAPDEAQARAALDEEERARHARLRLPRERRRHALSHLALRRILGRAVGREPAALRLSRDALGKPRIEPDGPPFNMAHSGDLALVAVGGCAPLGVDVEIDRPLGELQGLIRLCCTPLERAALDALPCPAERGRAFLAAWTRKEAALKACGWGLRARPGEVETGRGEWVRLLGPASGPRWARVVSIETQGALAAVATLGVRCNYRQRQFGWATPG